MVLNSRFILEGKIDEAVEEIRAVRQLMDRTNPSAPLRVICSTGLLRHLGGEEMVRRACQIVTRAAEGAEKGKFVMKTETGFVLKPDGQSKFGATVEDLELMGRELPPNVRKKASGGVSKKNALKIRAAGADYIGASGVVREFLV